MAPDYARLPELLKARGSTLGTPLAVFDEVASTNDEAKRAAKNGAPHGAAWISELQTAGRGRQGRAWLSPPGENVMLSVLVRLACPPLRVPLLSLVVGLVARDAVARAVDHPEQAKLKWPNDVLLEGRKVCGILVEAQFAANRVESIVIGVGLNVHTRDFPEPIRDLATSVALHACRTPDRAELIAELFEGLERDLPRVAAQGLPPVHARLSAADALRGQQVQSDRGESGIAEGIDTEGRLLVRRKDGALAQFVAGEIHLVKA